MKVYPYRDDDGRNDPRASGGRVLRGGSWVDSAWGVRAAFRYGVAPGLRYYTFGFRVVVSSPGAN
jgi:formylglycine-generating enzyme required for sulfatase activity